MRPSRRAALAGLIAGMGVGAAAAPIPPAAGRFVLRTAFPSRHAAPRDVRVWVPAAFRAGDPVIYMHDAQSAFDAYPGWFGPLGTETVLGRLIDARAVRPALVVAAANTPLRWREYMPAGVFDRLDPAYRERVRRGHGGAPLSDGYVRFLADELKPWVDATFRPSHRREETVTIGSSMGGLIALYAACERPEVFGGAGCLSPHWPLYAPDLGTYAPTEGEARTVAAAFQGYFAARLPPPGRTRLYLDHGDKGLDAGYAPFARRIDALLKARGWREGTDVISRRYPGADHKEASWKARLDVPLRFLLPAPRPA